MTGSVTPPEFEMVVIDTILIEDRSREVDQAWAEALAAMFREGGMLHPVTLWNSTEGPRLVAGAHRIAAQKINGQDQIAAIWSDASSLAEAKVLEITENIGRRELSALDRAQHLFDLKEAYEALHPESKKGGDRGNQHTGGKERQSEIFSFSQDAAEKVGVSPRAIQLAVALWKGLSASSKAKIRGTWLAAHQSGLTALAKEKAATQAKVLAMIFPPEGKQPKATSVADALFILENGRLYTSVERRFANINKTISDLRDEELDAVLLAHEERIMEWVKRRMDGEG